MYEQEKYSSSKRFIMDNLSKIAELPRHLISDGYDDALEIITEIIEELGLTYKIHSFQTGYDCGTWVIPEKWTLRRAQLKNKEGLVLIDTINEPLACLAYSLPFEGMISRDNLIEHLYTSPYCPEAVPFVFKYYDRDWGLCCKQELKDSLTEDEYYVSIDAEFAPGELKVCEIIVEGEFEESFVIASHLDHAYQVNDGPIGIFPVLEILSHLNQKSPHYTYRQLIVPENIGSAAWLSRNKELIPKLRGGLFVEMLGTDLPMCLHRSFKGNTLVDKLFEDIMHNNNKSNVIDDFVHANDERQFNGPGIGMPMLGLNRMSTHRKEFLAFPYYHTDFDNMENVNVDNLMESTAVLQALITAFDEYLIRPVPNFIGEPFLHRYNLHVDAFEGTKKMSDNIEMMNIIFMTGENITIYEIARRLQFSITKVKQVLDKCAEKGLFAFKPI